MRLSSRLPSSHEPNALSAALAARRDSGGAVLDLTVSNPTEAGFPFPAGILAALAAPEVLRYAPGGAGAKAAQEAIAAHHGHGVDPAGVLLTASTSEAYSWLFKAVGDPGDEVLVPSPSYPLFEWLARLEGLVARPVPAFFHEGWRLDLQGLEEACTARTKALVVVNPNNPTGQFLAPEEWAALTDLCARRKLLLIVDEVFADYALEAPADRLRTVLASRSPPCALAVLSGLSKVALLPQVKLAWLILRGQGTASLQEGLEFVADQFLSVSASAQAAAAAALAAAPALRARVLARARTNLAVLDRGLALRPGLQRLPVEGGWSVLLRRPAVDTDEACALRLLETEGVLVHPGHFFDIPSEGFLVLSLLTREPDFAEGTDRLLRAL
ncbi:MAG: pyridoxal phosphate-dependent aminotransferase [Holophagaceae bacterium]|nr:pyridoxal phosphate-dependent aminotransferase [Holophagaceae bacterium]